MKTGNSAVALVVLLLAILALQLLVNRGDDHGFYAADVRHPWNVVHETLVVRQAAARRYGDNELDPLVWMDSEHLLVGGSHQRALRVLDEFLAADHQRLIEDPLKRAVLQHDLWGLFDWLADPECVAFPKQKRKLRRRIAQVIRRIALPMEDIQQLPDNYAALLASEFSQFGRKPDSTPIDLFDKDGSAVLYVRKHETHSPHVDYEKQRIAHVFKTLKITDANLDEYFDFIIDFKICDTTLLEELNSYLAKTYGKNYFKKISAGKCPSLKEKVVIAEWTLMGAFAMHIYHQQVHLKSYTNKFITQIHTQGDMDKFKYDSKIVHFVKKNLDFEKIRERLDAII